VLLIILFFCVKLPRRESNPSCWDGSLASYHCTTLTPNIPYLSDSCLKMSRKILKVYFVIIWLKVIMIKFCGPPFYWCHTAKSIVTSKYVLSSIHVLHAFMICLDKIHFINQFPTIKNTFKKLALLLSWKSYDFFIIYILQIIVLQTDIFLLHFIIF